MQLPERVTICEVGTRDGFQIEPDFIATEQKIEVVDRLAEAGVPRIEVTSFVHPKAIPQLRDAEAVMAGHPAAPRHALRRAGAQRQGRGPRGRRRRGRHPHRAVGEREPQPGQREHDDRGVVEKLRAVAQIAARAGVQLQCGISTSFGCPFEGDVPLARLERHRGPTGRHGRARHRPGRHDGHGESAPGRDRAGAPDAALSRHRVDAAHARHARDGHSQHPGRDRAAA